MKRYSILRNNKESGPYTLRELKEAQLLSTDLVWMEGESNCWVYPEEIDELKEFITAQMLKPEWDHSFEAEAETKEKIPLLSGYTPVSTLPDAPKTKPDASYADHPSFEELKKKYEEKAPKRKVVLRPAGIGAGVFGFLILAIGVAMVSVMVKNALTHFKGQNIEATAEAHEITNENLLESNRTHAAMAPVNPVVVETNNALQTNTPNQVNNTEAVANGKAAALNGQTEPVSYAINTNGVNLQAVNQPGDLSQPINPALAPLPAKKTEKKTLDKTGKNEKKSAAKMVAELASPPTDTKPDENVQPAVEKKPETEASEGKLQLAANNYKVGLFGGISNLELTVTNTKQKKVETALIEVDYLKPNGNIAHTETVEINDLAAGASKTVAVPKSSRGVNVRYRVVNK